MAELVFLGGCREVGRSSVLLKTGKENLLFDYGLEVQDMQLPMKPKVRVDGIFLSHAHIDHSGLIPQLYKEGYAGRTYGTRATFDTTGLLLRDSLRVQRKKHETSLFLLHDIKKMERNLKTSFYGESEGIGGSSVEFHDAGHIPGSTSFIVNTDGKRIMYTGDIKFIDTFLLRGAPRKQKDIDALIIEATYSYKNHPDRKALADDLRELIQDTCYNNGIVILPSFAVGRTQEILLAVHDLGFPVYIDGMGIDATMGMLSNPRFLKEPDMLRKAFSRAKKITKNSERQQAIKKPCVVLTTAGMLNGGPVSFYIKKLHNREDCSLVMTGYQVEGTVGRTLIDTEMYINEGMSFKPRMKVRLMDFSAHTDRNHIIDFIEKTNPKKAFIMHSDTAEDFAEELNGRGFNAIAPANGERFTV